MPPILTDVRVRIAFGELCSEEWVAGCHYLKNLFIALKSLPICPELNMVRWKSDERSRTLDTFLDRSLYLPRHRSFVQRLAFFAQRKSGINFRVPEANSAYLRNEGIDVLFTVADQGPFFNLPWIAWIPDFQHLHLPNFFTEREVQRRNIKFRRLAEHAPRIVLSSQSAFGDFQRFTPEFVHKVRVLQFVSQLPEDVIQNDPAEMVKIYHLPERFIYLPNQFWKHKNHEGVAQALAIAKLYQPDLAIVCTGNTYDHRAPLYFPKLMATLSELNIRENFIILGVVPHTHVFQLMRQSLAILQPSMFEGWSTTVEEAKSLGKRIILSDIETHREQNPLDALWFNPHTPETLAEQLIYIYGQAQPGPDIAREAQAREALPDRTRQFGNTFLEIVRDTLLVH